MFFSSVFFIMSQMMHKFLYCVSQVVALRCDSLELIVYFNKITSFFFLLVEFFCSSRLISYLCLTHLIDFNNSIFYLDGVWFYCIGMNIIFTYLLVIIMISSMFNFNTTFFIIEASFHAGLSMTHRKNYFQYHCKLGITFFNL